MKIKTQRCIIREFIPTDIDAFMEYHNNMDWMQYQGFKGLSKKEYKEILLVPNQLLGKGKQFAIANINNNYLLGDIYLKQEGEVYWIGYTINPIYARQGYVQEAINAIITWASYHGGKYFRAGVLFENTASIQLLQKIGFTYLGESEDELIYIYDLKKNE